MVVWCKSSSTGSNDDRRADWNLVSKGQPRPPTLKEGLKQVEGRINMEQNLPVDATLCQSVRV